MRFTIFTPTYNRRYIIEKLYKSLKEQIFKDFEWIVIDDGSTDNTEELFSSFLVEDNFFKITYKKVENGGKHRAINKGVQMAQGELFYIVDSDDYLPEDALSIIDEVEKTIPLEQKNEFAGVCGVKAFSKDKIIGTTFEGDFLDITQLERSKYKIEGDKAEVFYTHILKKYPFPEFIGENFITECVVWDKIAFDGYKLRFFNKSVYYADYLPDGLTHNSSKIFINNPKGWGLYIYQCVKHKKIIGMAKWTEIRRYYLSLKNKLKFK